MINAFATCYKCHNLTEDLLGLDQNPSQCSATQVTGASLKKQKGQFHGEGSCSYNEHLKRKIPLK